MFDAQPAANAPARPPALQPPHLSPANADTTGVRSKPTALLAAATALLPELEAGRALDAKTLREAMSAAFGAGDTQGAWVWKDAYEATEAAIVLFIQRYGRLMRREAGAGPGSAAAMLAMLETLAALEPPQTRRSEEQLALQQFSTPLPLAYAALQAAAIRPGDIVLEPSAGTGMLAVMAECALGKHAGGALHLNEIAAVRAGLLAGLFEHAPVTRHNAESIADYLPVLHPTVVLMNPPFSASPRVQRIRHDADLRHLRSAFSMLPAGGRLVAITSAGCIPGDAAWSRAFERLDPPPRTVFSIAIDGRAYARRGTTFDTRLTVIDRDPANAQGVPVDARHRRSYDSEDLIFDPLHYLPLIEQKIGALDQAAPLAGWDLPEAFITLRRLLEARMGKAGKREYVQVLRLLETFRLEEVEGAVGDALRLGAIGFDAVKHLVLCRIERRPPRLNLDVYPYLPRARVAMTSAKSYMSLLSGLGA